MLASHLAMQWEVARSDGPRLPAALRGGSAGSSQLQREVPGMVERDFDHPHGTVATMMKDPEIIRELAQNAGLAMPRSGLATSCAGCSCPRQRLARQHLDL
ncbi:MAG TPA: NAD-binding protein [Hyphomicrobiaceae bacterium]